MLKNMFWKKIWRIVVFFSFLPDLFEITRRVITFTSQIMLYSLGTQFLLSRS